VFEDSPRVLLFIEQNRGRTRLAIRAKQCSDVSVALFPVNQVSTEVDNPVLRFGW
jgi:hypothetical protein